MGIKADLQIRDLSRNKLYIQQFYDSTETNFVWNLITVSGVLDCTKGRVDYLKFLHKILRLQGLVPYPRDKLFYMNCEISFFFCLCVRILYLQTQKLFYGASQSLLPSQSSTQWGIPECLKPTWFSI